MDGGHSSKSASVLLVTIWELGEAAGPLFIAPLSEIIGRYPVVNGANMLFVTASILAALSQSTGVMIAARALTGLAVASNVLNPAIIGDMFVSEERGSAMSLIMLAPLFGGALGPAISGVIAQSLGWRTVVWISVFLAAACELAFLAFFRETYKVPILRRRAARLRQETGDATLKTEFDQGKAGSKALWESVMRPVVVFAGSGVLQALSLFGSLVFTFFYIMSTTLPDILEGLYGLSPAMAGFCFISFSQSTPLLLSCPCFPCLSGAMLTRYFDPTGIGSLFSVVFCNVALDRIYIRLGETHPEIGKPELRLPLVIVGGLTLPFVVALYGWATQVHLDLFFILLILALMGMTLLLAFLPLMAYVVDAFGMYSASAITAVIVSRCLMGTFLPLTSGPLVDRFGYGWGFTILAAVLLMMWPIPILVMKRGLKWRQGSKYTRDN